ncbi:MAG: helix-turn-helix domain-containing protein [Steroidobacteraceae bacterium]
MSTYWTTLVSGAFDRSPPRPQDRATLRAAALELRARGLTPLDIAEALRLSERAVRDLLHEVPHV